MEDSREILVYLRLPIWGSITAALEENQMEKVPPANPTHPITSVFLHSYQMATAFHKSRTA